MTPLSHENEFSSSISIRFTVINVALPSRFSQEQIIHLKYLTHTPSKRLVALIHQSTTPGQYRNNLVLLGLSNTFRFYLRVSASSIAVIDLDTRNLSISPPNLDEGIDPNALPRAINLLEAKKAPYRQDSPPEYGILIAFSLLQAQYFHKTDQNSKYKQPQVAIPYVGRRTRRLSLLAFFFRRLAGF